jgi:hypothetical protein
MKIFKKILKIAVICAVGAVVYHFLGLTAFVIYAVLVVIYDEFGRRTI